jgi:hypothetical protein
MQGFDQIMGLKIERVLSCLILENLDCMLIYALRPFQNVLICAIWNTETVADPNYKICLHTKSKQQHEVTFHTNLFCLD